MTSGVELIGIERTRQVLDEGHTPEYDLREHDKGELAEAALSYLKADGPGKDPPYTWPWPKKWWKPTTRLRNLIKAGALIAAEIDRLGHAQDH